MIGPAEPRSHLSGSDVAREEDGASNEAHPELGPVRGPAHGCFQRMALERFEALTLWGRPAAMREDSLSASAWATVDERVLIGVFHLLETREFLCVGFARDAAGRYRLFQCSPMLPSLRAGDLAIAHDLGADFLAAAVDLTHLEPLPTGMDLFEPLQGIKRLHPAYVMLRDGYNQRAARELITEMAHWLPDRDGNFVRDFQTSGYSARIWELYLWAAFTALDFAIDPACAIPDFCLDKRGARLFVEATTVNGPDSFAAAMGQGPPESPPGDFLAFLEHDMPQKFGSPLFSKLKKRYWEQPHVAGHPLVLAIADFHAPASMRWSHNALPFYLYGVGVNITIDADGRVSGKEKPLGDHVVGSKTVPTNFFAQPDAEHIAAVLFSNAGTVVKFSRMGVRAGYGDPWVSLVRSGVWNDPGGGFDGIPFKFDVESPDYEEGWPDELRLFHNPNALYPVDEALFPGIAHVRLEDGEHLIRTPANRVLFSETRSYDFLRRTAGRPEGWTQPRAKT